MLLIRINEDINSASPRVDRVRTFDNLRLKWFLDSRKCIVLVESLKEYFPTSSLEEFIKSV